jgi:hypothetical protein
VAGFCDFHPHLEAGWTCPQCHQSSCERCLQDQAPSEANYRCPVCHFSLTNIPKQKAEQRFGWHARSLRAYLFSKPLGLLLGANLALSGLSVQLGLEVQPTLILLCLLPLLLGMVMGATIMLKGTRRHPLVSSALNFRDIFGHCALLAGATGAGFWLWSEMQLAAVVWSFVMALVAPLLMLSYLFSLESFDQDKTVRARLHRVWIVTNIGFAGLLSVAGLLSFLSVSLGSQYFIYASACLLSLAIPVIYCLIALNSCSVEAQNIAVSVRPLSEHEKRDELIQLALRTGRFDDARAQLIRECYRSDSPDYRFVQLYRLLVFQKDWHALAHHTPAIVTYFLKRGRDEEVFHLLENLRTELPDFFIQDLSLLLRLAKRCANENKHILLLWLAREAHERFPHERLRVAELYLRVSRIMREHYHEPELASGFARFARECVDDYSYSGLEQTGESPVSSVEN